MEPIDFGGQTAVQGNTPTAPGTRLEPMLIRLPPALATELRNLARRTRVRQSDYLREAVADLIAKYAQGRPDDGGSAM
ncbi:MAG TPA: ribbon-helix-helix domain-containing protein [Anaeromyxobacter sp.]|nr:ribbon-helix-helix domain-containing protein [Anaeromyxobacter sp.]